MSLSVRVIAPFGRDSELIAGVLEQHGLAASVSTLDSVIADHPVDAIGPLLIAEEALNPSTIERLGAYLQKQPSWSDLPILILTGSGRETQSSSRRNAERSPLGAPVLLERPIRTATLVSSVEAALRARVRQYQIRDVVAELKKERELLEAMLDSLPVGVIFAKVSGEIVRANRRLEEILRHPMIPSPDIESYAQWMAFHPDGSKVAAREFPLPRAMETGQSIAPEDYQYQRGDGTKGWIRAAASPVLDENSEVTGGVVVIADIDQQKRSEVALIQNEKLAAVGRLAASISHEINNPLEAVTNLLYLARQDEHVPSQVKGYLELADQELARVSQIVSHTLQFHRQATNPRTITVEKLIEPALGLYAGRLSNANITLVQQYRATDPITCYDGEIRQVLNNLIGNAVESMKLGGRLIVRSTAATSPTSGVRGVRITIADTGHGMDRKVLAHVFEAFYTTKGINGTGLGLWISKGIMDKHQGSIRVKSRTTAFHSGTVFSIFLPTHPVLISA